MVFFLKISSYDVASKRLILMVSKHMLRTKIIGRGLGHKGRVANINIAN